MSSQPRAGGIGRSRTIDHDQELYLPAEDQTARDAQLERIVQRGYSWWRYVREEGVPNLVLQLADHTRWTLRQEGDWPFFDTASTVYHGHDPFRDGGPNAGEKLYKGAVMSASNVLAAQDLLEESAGAMLAFWRSPHLTSKMEPPAETSTVHQVKGSASTRNRVARTIQEHHPL